ncbi:MAG: hypothetical protein E6R04_04000 [Spirochaetes bacterium]|nr:MAG: hypothetical protein E6R04_04000 [Spirochaetota bacterium]
MLKTLLLSLCLSTLAFASEDSGVVVESSGGVIDAGVVTVVLDDIVDAGVVVDAGVPTAPVINPATLDNPMVFVKVIVDAVKAGDWVAAAAALLVLIVALLKVFGKRLHDFLPDTSPLDKPLWFLLDTKPGGWLMNFLTSTGAGVGLSLLAGEKITWALLKPILSVSLTAAALWGLVKDINDWIKAAKEKKAAEPKPEEAKPVS